VKNLNVERENIKSKIKGFAIHPNRHDFHVFICQILFPQKIFTVNYNRRFKIIEFNVTNFYISVVNSFKVLLSFK
jgi:hypothetical protein